MIVHVVFYFYFFIANLTSGQIKGQLLKIRLLASTVVLNFFHIIFSASTNKQDWDSVRKFERNALFFGNTGIFTVMLIIYIVPVEKKIRKPFSISHAQRQDDLDTNTVHSEEVRQ